MVLHNDKWAKKAKRAVERRKGITKPKHHAAEHGHTTLERLDMGRPTDAELETVQDDELSSDSGSDSFEFDSGDENKFLDKSSKVTTSDSQPQPQPKNTSAWRRNAPTAQQQTNRQSGGDTTEAITDDIAAVPKVDRRFARRKLVDNSSRYEEPVLDPYLQPVETEPEIDYASLTSRAFTNPREVERVPDLATARKTPQVMEDTTHFDRLRQLQQKVEYARDMKLRFGQRAGYERTKGDEARQDDDAFFDAITSGDDVVKDSELKRQAQTNKPQADRAAHESLEKYLDDLLKL